MKIIKMFNHHRISLFCFYIDYKSCDGHCRSYSTNYNDDTSGTPVVAIVISVWVAVLIIIIVSYFIYRYKRKKRFNQQLISSRHNQNVRTHGISLASVHRNATRANAIHIAYTIPLSGTFEQEPPSYASVVSPFRTQH